MTDNCPFCRLEADKLLFSKELAFAMTDRFPVSPGHCLVLPKRHFPSLFDATHKERAALWELVDQTRNYLMTKYQPDGFNIGVNDGVAAGQTVMHLHIHIIPRYAGDNADPRGGIRWVMPEKAPYWND